MRQLFDATARPVLRLARDGVVRYLDRRNGITTQGEVPLREFGLDAEDRNHYGPANWFALRRILRRGEVSNDDVFIDVGSGKGRAVFQAARDYPFRRVIGVEISPELNEIARRNIEGTRPKRQCADVQLVTADILDYEFPDDVTVVYLNNPFNGKLFAAAVNKLLRSHDRCPRTIRLIYSNPLEHDHLMRTGRFRSVRRVRGLRPGREWSQSNSTRMYEVLPK